MVKIAVSILNADFGHLADEVRRAEEAGVELVHLDIMDGHFVPNLTMGAQIVKSLRIYTRLPFEAHLMITHPENFFAEFIKSGSNLVIFHIETTPQPVSLLEEIKKCGVKAGLVVNPETPVEKLFPFLGIVDQVLVMSVHPGFGGQKFISGALDKIKALAEERRKGNLKFEIEVDGGVNAETGKLCREAGVDILVAGTYLFQSNDIKKSLLSLIQPQ